MPTSEECERAEKFNKILWELGQLMDKSLPEDLVEAGELTGTIYALTGHFDTLIRKKCKRP